MNDVDPPSKNNDQLLREAQALVRRGQQRLDRASDLTEDSGHTIQHALGDLRDAIKDNDVKKIKSLIPSTYRLFEEHLGPVQKSVWREYGESIGMAIVVALILRGFVLEAFTIPTVSMVPTLLVGDYLFVNKFVYGVRVPFTQNFLIRFSEPKRGEVVVFTFPRKEAREFLATKPAPLRQCIDEESLTVEKNFIKRVIGLPGDTVELRDNIVFLNGEPLKRSFLRKETTGKFLYPHTIQEREQQGDATYTIQYSGQGRNFGPIKVRPGHVFVMGDNRDYSSDSRCWGQVPIQNIKGRAMIIWWSIAPDMTRWDRMGSFIK